MPEELLLAYEVPGDDPASPDSAKEFSAVILYHHPINSYYREKDALKWMKRANPLEARKITCPRLTEHLYTTWGWDRDYVYRTIGKLVTSGSKVMLLFDFSEPECWKRPEAKNVK